MTGLKRSLSLILLPAAILASFASSAANWPEFRGPNRAGSTAGSRFPTVFGPNTNLAWKTTTPSGHSSPVLWGNQLLLTGFESNQLLTLAYDRRTGSELWRRALDPGPIESGSRLSHPATATPCTDGERSISYFAPFGLVAYDPAGRELWRHPLPTPITGHGASSSPVLAGDLVLLLCDQDVASYLLALDKKSGRLRWRQERPDFRRGFSTPLPWPAQNPDSVVIAGTLRLAAYSLADGSERWRVHGLPNEMVASPIAAGDLIVVAGWTSGSGVPRMPEWKALMDSGDANHDGALSRDEAPAGPAKQHFHYIDADRDGRLSRQEYETIAHIFDASKNVALAIRPGGSGDVTDSHVVWRQTRGLPYVPSPLFIDNKVFLVRNGGLASCIDAASGRYHFQEERLGALGDYYASPVAAGDRILAVSQPGTAVVVRVAESLEVLARNPLGDEVLATPAIADDTLYLRSKSSLWAFREQPTAP